MTKSQPSLNPHHTEAAVAEEEEEEGVVEDQKQNRWRKQNPRAKTISI